MTQKNETKTLILSLLVTGAILAGGGYWAYSTGLFGNQSNNPSTSSISSNGNNRNINLADRLSEGGRLLIASQNDAAKQAGIQAYAQQNYTEAVSQLESYLNQNKNDPEARIYLNNAKIANSNSYALVVASAPIGSNETAAEEILRGVAQAQTEINEAGGINNTPLKILIANDDNDPAIAQQLAQEFVNNENVLGVVGHFGSDTSQAAAQVYQENGLVMISPTSTSVELSETGNYIFRTVPNDRFTARALAKYQLETIQKQQAAVFYNSQSGYSESLKNAFSTDIVTQGGQVVSEFDLSSGFNAATALQEAKTQGAEVLVLLANSATLDQALQVIQANQKELPMLGGDSLYNPKVIEQGGENAVDLVVGVAWHILATPNAPFVQESQQMWGGEVNWRTAMAYDAIEAFIQGLRQTPNATRDGLQQTLSAANFTAEGASNPIRFLPSGDRNQAVQLVKVQPGNRTSFGYEFVPVAE